MRLTNNTYGIRNLQENIKGTVSGIYFYKYKTVNDAITEIIEAYRAGNIHDKPNFHNLNWMKRNGFTELLAAS